MAVILTEGFHETVSGEPKSITRNGFSHRDLRKILTDQNSLESCGRE